MGSSNFARGVLFIRLRQLGSPIVQHSRSVYVQGASFASHGKENEAFGGGTFEGPTSPSASWLQKLKGLWGGKESASDGSQQHLQQPRSKTSPAASAEEQLDLESFADQLKKARQFGKLTQFGRGLPKGGEAIAQRSLERQEEILRKLAAYSPDGQRLSSLHKIEVATQCGCSVRDVEDVLGKYEWTREANNRIIKLKEQGKPLPKSLDEIEKLMGGRWRPSASVNLSKDAAGSQHSRNCPCPCGSGKKYKRCCGKD